jgi:hypothetical protein
MLWDYVMGVNGNGPTQTFFIKSNWKDSEEGKGPTKFLIQVPLQLWSKAV